MTDYFAVLGAARRPFPDLAALKESFHRLSMEAGQGDPPADRQSLLNEAHQCLSETKTRLKHLHELEFGVAPEDLRQIPQDLSGQAFEFGKLCRDTDQFLARKASAHSPLLMVGFAEESLEWTDRFQEWQKRFAGQWSELNARLEALNSTWMDAAPVGDPDRPGQLPRMDLVELIHRSGYLTRWTEQARDRVTKLAL